ncbi:MAG: hypothetical protein O2798_07870 [Chloroflexi bacterium]|nr:hypothetical protein [Chloroflexota bacterium]
MSLPTLVIMLGGMDGGPAEALLRSALEAAALDAAEIALESGAAGRALLLADRAPSMSVPAGVEVETDADVAFGGPFQFGERLAAAVRKHRITRLVYVGAGSAPLLTAADWRALAAVGVRGPARCVTNNRFSADLFALRPASMLASLAPPPRADNGVPRRLAEDHGVAVTELPRTVETQFNLDTPNDLVTLALAGRGGPRLRRVLKQARLDTSRVSEASRVFVDRTKQMLVAGRVPSRTWRYLETEAACRVRVLSEERGMQSAGTDVDGTARSLLGQWIAEAGPERAFGELLPELCDAAFLDIRPALVQLGIRASRADRFAADLGQAGAIEDPALRRIVAAAVASPVPVVLGGHSLVGGCMHLLNQWAWDEHDRLAGRR